MGGLNAKFEFFSFIKCMNDSMDADMATDIQ